MKMTVVSVAVVGASESGVVGIGFLMNDIGGCMRSVANRMFPLQFYTCFPSFSRIGDKSSIVSFGSRTKALHSVCAVNETRSRIFSQDRKSVV